MSAFAGFDHIDCRVTSLAAVESFYDALMPELGLPIKRFSHVDANGDWQDVSSERPCNVVEYYEVPQDGFKGFFIGFIERRDHVPGYTRIAFRVEPARLLEIEQHLIRIGARSIERSEDIDEYPAIFFEDPAGTKLEIIARRPA